MRDLLPPARMLPVMLAAFVCTLGFGAVIPSLPLYARDHFGATPTLTGFVVGVAAAAALAGRVIAGPMSDRRGRRLTALIGLGLCVVAGLLYLPIAGMLSLIAARILHGAGEGFVLTAAVAWAIDLAPPDRRAQTLGFLATGVWGGLSLGPLVSAPIGGLPYVAYFVSASALPVLFLLRRVDDPPHEPSKASKPIHPMGIQPGFVLGLANVSYAAIAGFLPLLLAEHGVRGSGAFGAFAAMVMLGRTFLGSLPDRIGPVKTLFGGLSLIVAGLAIMPFARSTLTASLAAAIVGMGYAFPWPSLAVTVVERVSPAERATALGTLTAFYDLFVALGSVAAGALATRFGLTAPFWMAIACCATAALIAWDLFRSLTPPGHKAAASVETDELA